MAEARSTGKDVLVDKATSGTSLTWARPDGQMRTQVTAVPQRAKNSAGQWAPIDLKLTRTGNTVQPGNSPVPVRFSAGSKTPGDTTLAEMDLDGRTITYTWPGALPEPVLDGSRALYPEVLSGVDLLLVAREEGGFANLLIVKNREAAANKELGSLAYGLSSAQAVFRHDSTTGGVRIFDAKTKAEIGSVPTPFAWDSSGRDPESPTAPRLSVATPADVLELSGLQGLEPGVRQAPMPTRLDGDGTGKAVLHLDAAGTGLLTDKNVRFPVFLDPPINSGEQAWTLVHKPNPNSNFLNGTGFNGGTSEARVGYETETNGLARSFWRMAFKNIKGATVSSASFKVLNTHSWSCTKREFQLWHTGAISSGTTWNKQPSWITLQQKVSFAYGYASSCSDDYAAFNIKNAAQAAADSGSTNLTLGMRATSEGDTETWRKFKANSATLEATYNTPPKEPTGGTTNPGGACTPGPGNGVTIAKTNIVLSATATDPDGNLEKLRFRYWKTGGTVPSGVLVTPNSSGKASTTIASTTLVDKATYSWDVRSEDSSDAVSSFFPGNTTEPCRFTVDASAPAAPEVTSDDYPEATSDGATWATKKFGETGSVTFTAEGAARFEYSFEYISPLSVTANASGTATVTGLKPRHAGPTSLIVYAYDKAGNRSVLTSYTTYVPPRDDADGPGDTGGDGINDLLVVDGNGHLRTLPGDLAGELYTSLASSYTTGNKLNPAGHWFDSATGKSALIAHYDDAYPGDGITDLFARTPDGGFYLYPGDGYGSFNVDQRLRVLLPSNTPAPSTWTELLAVGDITGDKRPDLALRAGTAFWVLSGYSGASFQEAVLMEGTAWARRDLIAIRDIDVDGTPDLLWRNLDAGGMYVRHGKPGTIAGSVSLDSIKIAGNSRAGDVSYGTNWQETAIKEVISFPDSNADGVADLWAISATDGNTRLYNPSKTNTGASIKTVLSNDWRSIKAFG
ncbi:hypothetical protein AFR_03700 [Actinoplanes friuliensis DSM 7358]|uniref:Uncharacterized protein n=2 Tax=Actinoplanes friuliensis TaxID=196914 RepID=U5VQE4_9ACTN|nr:hypothetical protein AFR_03700 [Actinoplanes friuliensis DSM 7358]